MLIQQNIDRNKEIYPVCIFEGFIGKEVFRVKWFDFQCCLNIYVYQNTSQICRRIFRHFFDREIVINFFSLKFRITHHVCLII